MNSLFSISRKNDTKGGSIIWTESQIAYIINEYNSTHSTVSIAKQFGTNPQMIRNVLRKNRVNVLSLSELGMLNFPRNSNFFESVDTPVKAYWLGFLYADGYIGKEKDKRVRITLKKSDEQHLSKFLSAIEANNTPIKYSQKKDGDKIFEQAYCCLRDAKLVEDLNRAGCVNCKSYTLTFPNTDILPEKLQSHFIRGYFDGDGSLHSTLSGKNKTPRYRITFVGTKSFLESLRHILGKEHIAIENRDTYCMFSISGNKQLIPILEYLYKDSNDSIELTRKRQIYNKFLLQVQ